MSSLRDIAEASTILAERREHDRLADISFYPHQDTFLRSEKHEAWIFGANRSGKTEVLAASCASVARFGARDPRPAFIGGGNYIMDRATRQWCVSLNAEMSRNILQPKIFDNGMGLGDHYFIPIEEMLPGSTGWNITNQTLKLKNGSIIIFKTCEQGPKAFQGEALDQANFDEVPEEFAYKETGIRLGSHAQLYIRGAATILPPPGVAGGVSWMYSSTVRPWLDAGGNEASPDLDIFTASIYDNPTLDKSAIRKLEAKYPPGSQEARIRLGGELLPSIGGALVYSNFSRSYHVNENLAPMKEGRREPNIDPAQPLVLSADFNPEGGVWIVGQRRRGVFCVVDEICLERSDIGAMIYEFRSRYPSHGAELWIYGDATGRRRNEQTGLSNFHLMHQYLEGYPVPVRMMIPALNPPVTDRVNAVQLQLRPPTGEKLMELSPLCEQTILDMEGTKYKSNGKINKTGSRRSDGADSVGYWVMGAAPVMQFGRDTSRLTSIKPPGTRPGSARVGPFPATIGPRVIRAGRAGR